MPELHIQRVDEQLEITFGEHRSTVAWADIASWTPEDVEKNAEAYGHTLFEQITQDMGLRDALTAFPRHKRLVLVADQPEVSAIPWEYLRLPEASGGLLLATRYNLVRGIPEGQRQEGVVLDGVLRIVAVPVSAVNERIPLNTEGEWKNLSETVKERNKVVTLQRVRPPTLAKMRSALNGECTTIVQFMGHSGIVDGKGVLIFEDELGRVKAITSAQFANTLDEQTLLVVLNSCYSATVQGIASGQDSAGAVSALGNIARLVVHEDIPYALGMQFALPDNAALAITNALYDALLQGRSVEEAVRSMRASLEHKAMLQDTQWLMGVPVLYTSLQEPAPALKLATGQPTLVPDPVHFARTFDLSALSTPQHFFGRDDDISRTLDESRARGYASDSGDTARDGGCVATTRAGGRGDGVV